MTLAARDYRVLYIEEPLFEEGAEPDIRVEPDISGVEIVTPILPTGLSETRAVEEQAKLTQRVVTRAGSRVDVCWYYTPMAYEFSDTIAVDVRVYDCMDELSAFKGASRRLSDNEHRLLDVADVVFTGGRSLYEAKRQLHKAVYLFPSSVDQAHFRKARRSDLIEPAVQSGLDRPRIGYFGVIDERMDLELVEAVARMRADFQFILVGPVAKIEEASLPRAGNLHWLGQQEYRMLPNFVSGWDMAYMPFALNESTRYISPTKTPELLAAGVPVVSTPIADVVRPYGELGLVKIAASPHDMLAAIEASLSAPKELWLRGVDNFLAGMSWESTWSNMHEILVAAASLPRLRVGMAPALSAARANHV
ncbi:UDP-galactopyranose mutase [Mycoplana sp. BE70]|uniref:glycosyltransferase n=1 Tax=Mycoplana sp. BE70 TaxID=2817775 RepID=UPI0028596E19|nr:glycosyltransferase [Mycoplana sp. BE70]MDR6759535.1 UDP-galactopyranose mutase [Mycoplana sp. BE70]